MGGQGPANGRLAKTTQSVWANMRIRAVKLAGTVLMHRESAGGAEFTIGESSAKPLQEQIAKAAGERTDGEEEA